MDRYSIKSVYEKMRGDRGKVEWRKLVWANYGAPKWLFMLYIALNRRLSTKVRLAKWGVTTNMTCPLCEDKDEDIDHLFFECAFSGEIWNKLLSWQGIQRASSRWHDEVQWALTHMKGNNCVAQVYRMTLAGAIYCLWMERNYRIFQHKHKQKEAIIRQIIQIVHVRGFQHVKLRNRLQELNDYP